jgi:DNA-binding HxlR family transcriptional regulator
MARRSYQQYCGLAAALDVVGERWALLIIRDLTPGPRRFTDLFAGLPGIATDVLADRLRSLEAAGAVRLSTIRHPVPAKLYELTPRGRELGEIAAALGRWGAPLLPSPPPAATRLNPRWALQSMCNSYAGGLPPGALEWSIDDEVLTIEVSEGAVLRYGPAADGALLQVRLGRGDFFRLVTGQRPRAMDVVGDPVLLERFLAACPLLVKHSVDAP